MIVGWTKGRRWIACTSESLRTAASVHVGLLLLGTIVIEGCSAHPHQLYTMMVEIQTPSGVVRGTATRKLTFYDGKPAAWLPIIGPNRASISVQGSAVSIGLPDRRTVYALLNGADGYYDYAKDIPLLLIPDFRNRTMPSAWYDIHPCPGKSAAPPERSLLPKMVVFGDTRRIDTVRVIDPCTAQATLGTGFSVRRIAIRVASADATIDGPPPPSAFDDHPALSRWFESVPLNDPRQIVRAHFIS